jgi:hypothetical protein
VDQGQGRDPPSSRSDKLASLPDDSSRLGYIYALLEAKTQRRMGVFAGRAHLVDVMGRFGAYVDGWLEAGLIHVAPALCDGCAGRHGPDQLRPGEIVIHDYLMEQRDPDERRAAKDVADAAGRAAGARGGRDHPPADRHGGRSRNAVRRYARLVNTGPDFSTADDRNAAARYTAAA